MARRGGLSLSFKGGAELERRLTGLAGAANDDLEKAVRAHAEDVMADAQENHVPVMDGTLRASGYVQSGRQARGVWAKLGFSAPYARKVHENPRAGNTGGVSPSGRQYPKWAKVGGWKFLERPLKASEGRFLETVASVIQAAWQRKLGAGS